MAAGFLSSGAGKVAATILVIGVLGAGALFYLAPPDPALSETPPQTVETPAAAPAEPATPAALAEARARASEALTRQTGLASSSSQRFFRLRLGRMQQSMDAADAAEAAQKPDEALAAFRSVIASSDEIDALAAAAQEYTSELARVDEALEQAEDRRAATWDETRDDFAAAARARDEARDLADEENFAPAVPLLAQALEKLEGVLENARLLAERRWREGSEALGRGDGATARAALRVVSEIEPERAGLRDAIARARTIDVVHPLEQEGLRYEREGHSDVAQGVFEKILGLDPLSPIAQAGFERTRQANAGHAFAQTLIALEEAVRDEHWEAAEQLVVEATALQPEHARVRQLGAAVKEELFSRKIQAALYHATEAERRFEWDLAMTHYEEAVRLNPDLADAQEGGRRVRLAQAKDAEATRQMKEAERAAETDETESIDRALAYAKNAAHFAVHPELRERSQGLIETLEKRRVELVQPVELLIRSDGATRVLFWRVGKFEPFKEKRVRVPPGRYKLSGTREGFVEAFVEIEVKPLMEGQAVDVICSAKI